MPDEALLASLQGRPRQAPDFSPLALAHLHSNCQAMRQLIEQYLSAPSQAHLKPLMSEVKLIRQTLQLLNKHGAVFVASEISLLLDAMLKNETTVNADACACTLEHAGKHLADYVAHLRKSDAMDSALLLLPVINNCRACRNEKLLSEVLVVANGVELPKVSSLPLPGHQQMNTFVGHLNESLNPMNSALAAWFTDHRQLHTSLKDLKDIFADLSKSCDAPTSLKPLGILFDSAEFVCHSLLEDALDKSAALHRLFCQIDHLLLEYRELISDDAQLFAQAIPERLLLNMLYYVALSSEDDAKSIALRQRFRLDQFSVGDAVTQHYQVDFEEVGDRLAESIRDAIEIETEAAREWLSDADNSTDHFDRVRTRLAQLEPALLLLGAHESVRHLVDINESFKALDSSIGPVNSDVSKRIADSLVRLERALDVEVKAIRARKSKTQPNDLESVIAVCLSEAQLRLLSIEEDLTSLFGAQAPRPNSVSVMQINAKLAEINSALQVLPLPEVSPLITGVQSFIARHENKTLSPSASHDLATVMVSLGYYLNGVLNSDSNGVSGQLLLEAEEALLNLDIERLEENNDTLNEGTFNQTRMPETATHNMEYDMTIVDHATDTEVEGFIDFSLQQLNAISNALYEYQRAGMENKDEYRLAQRYEMKQAYKLLQDEAVVHKSSELEALARSNIRLLNSTNDSLGAQALLEESVAVLPQLINQFHGSSDKVVDLKMLLSRIDDAAIEDLTLAMDVQGILDHSDLTEILEPSIVEELDDTNALTQSFSWENSTEFESTRLLDQNATDSLSNTSILDLTADDVPVMTLDNTLEQVFYRECDQHIISLRKCVDDALASDKRDDEPQLATLNLAVSHSGNDADDVSADFALPNKDLLRALHTLTGSAQTVDAQSIIAIAQPLQKAALNKQRNGEVFNRAETKYIAELIDILQVRLAAMEEEQEIVDDNEAIMARLQEFVAHSEAWVPERKPGLELSNKVGTIENVFLEEARELLDTVRSEAARLSDDSQCDDAIDKIQRCLHTIKGSARMSGQISLAERAHALEDEIALAEAASLNRVVQTGLGELQTLLLVEKTVIQDTNTNVPERTEPMVLSEASFENLFALASRATVSRAKLGESMLRLRDAYSDIETTSARLQRLPHDHADLNSAAIAEMLGDLESARQTLADALQLAEAEQTQGLRADSALHQTLIRAQLVSFSECRTRLQHTANDAATETGKPIEFALTGEELNLDKSMFSKLMTPLEHLLRNAVVHGIEPESERLAAGKSATGRVAVDAKIDGTDVLVEVSDDGAGIDQARIKSALNETGLILENSSEQLLDVLTEPGFTTHSDADQLGGRGLGLSTVKQLVEELDGTMQLSTPEHGGTVFALRLPQKIRINQVVLVEHQAHCYAIPVNFIHAVSDEQYDLAQTSIQHNNTDYDCCSLDAIIKRDIAVDTPASAKRIILMSVHSKQIALLVDKVIGYREIIAQPLGTQLSQLKRYLGGAVLSDGRAVLIPDFNRLIDPEKSLPMSNWSASNSGVLRRTALIVDDSITMRTAAERMLESFLIEPSIARDGAEAVELIAHSLPDVLLVDIDMPRMNGFDFLRHLRVLHPEHEIPVVMISTRDTDHDRDQAAKLGAKDYLVKPYTETQMRNALTNLGVLSANQARM